jgi:hypothetical protein
LMPIGRLVCCANGRSDETASSGARQEEMTRRTHSAEFGSSRSSARSEYGRRQAGQRPFSWDLMRCQQNPQIFATVEMSDKSENACRKIAEFQTLTEGGSKVAEVQREVDTNRDEMRKREGERSIQAETR